MVDSRRGRRPGSQSSMRPRTMTEVPEWAHEARIQWRYTGRQRPAFAHTPGAGQRSVWDFPRPPIVESVKLEVRVRIGEFEIARSHRCLRVLETSSPPTYYIPRADTDLDTLRPTANPSLCEWKGEAHYWDVVVEGDRLPHAAWSYPTPFPEFEALRDHFSFYPSRVDCFVGSIRALPQPGGFYGGWITPDLVGPFKGEPGIEDAVRR
jgi:uncharacterized protein (DUF427 family)